MRIDRLIAALARRPFLAFRVELADGAGHVVRHPAQVIATRSVACIGVEPFTKGVYASVETVALEDIVALAPWLPPPDEAPLSADALHRWTRREPFAPFRLEFRDGTRFDVPGFGNFMVLATEVVIRRDEEAGMDRVPMEDIARVVPLPPDGRAAQKKGG